MVEIVMHSRGQQLGMWMVCVVEIDSGKGIVTVVVVGSFGSSFAQIGALNGTAAATAL
jgi:aspartate 1-decarboxylase